MRLSKKITSKKTMVERRNRMVKLQERTETFNKLTEKSRVQKAKLIWLLLHLDVDEKLQKWETLFEYNSDCENSTEIKVVVRILINIIWDKLKVVPSIEVIPLSLLLNKLKEHWDNVGLILYALSLIEYMIVSSSSICPLKAYEIISTLTQIVALHGKHKLATAKFKLMMYYTLSIIYAFTNVQTNLQNHFTGTSKFDIFKEILSIFPYLIQILEDPEANAAQNMMEYSTVTNLELIAPTIPVRAAVLHTIFYVIEYCKYDDVKRIVLRMIAVYPNCHEIEQSIIIATLFCFRGQIVEFLKRADKNSKMQEIAHVLPILVQNIDMKYENCARDTDKKWTVVNLNIIADIINFAGKECVFSTSKTDPTQFISVVRSLVQRYEIIIETLDLMHYEIERKITKVTNYRGTYCGHIIATAKMLNKMSVISNALTDHMIPFMPLFSPYLVDRKYHGAFKLPAEWAKLQDSNCFRINVLVPGSSSVVCIEMQPKYNAEDPITPAIMVHDICSFYFNMTNLGNQHHVRAMLDNDLLAVVGDVLGLSNDTNLTLLLVKMLANMASKLGYGPFKGHANQILGRLWGKTLPDSKTGLPCCGCKLYKDIRKLTVAVAPYVIDEVDDVCVVSVLPILDDIVSDWLVKSKRGIPGPELMLVWAAMKRNISQHFDSCVTKWDKLLKLLHNEYTNQDGLSEMSTKEKVFRSIVVHFIEYLDHPDRYNLCYFRKLTECMATIASNITGDDECFALEDLVTPALIFIETQQDKLVIQNVKSFIDCLRY